MGKKHGRSSVVAQLPFKVDRAVFGNLVIAQQSPVETARFTRNLFTAPPTPWVEPPRRARSQHDLAATVTNGGEFDAREGRNVPDGGSARDLRRSCSHESTPHSILKQQPRSSPPPPVVVVLRRNPNYGRRSPSGSSASSSLRSSSNTTDDEVFSAPPSRSPSMSRGSSIEEEEEDVRSVATTTDEWREAVVRDNHERAAGKRRVSFLVDELLYDIYEKNDVVGGGGAETPTRRRRNSCSSAHESDGCSSSVASSCRFAPPPPLLRGGTAFSVNVQRARLHNKGVEELGTVLRALRYHVQYVGALLVKELKRREVLISKRDKQYDVITAFLQAHSEKRRIYWRA